MPALLWGVWLAQALWWAIGRYARSYEPRVLLDIVANVIHNGALFVIASEACLIYATAGWYKIQGSRWQDGTAVYYPLHLDYFSPWPALADLLAGNGTMVMLVTYGTVIVQVAFPFTLFNRRVKNVLLALMMAEHAAIAVLLGLPFFSLAMIATDAVFLPTSFLRRLGGWVARARGRVFSAGDPALLPEGGVPAPPPAGGPTPSHFGAGPAPLTESGSTVASASGSSTRPEDGHEDASTPPRRRPEGSGAAPEDPDTQGSPAPRTTPSTPT